MFWGFSNPQNNLKIWCSSTLHYCARMSSRSSRLPVQEKINSDGTINKHKHSTSFFLLLLSFNPLWEFLRLGNSEQEFLGVNFWPRDFFRL